MQATPGVRASQGSRMVSFAFIFIESFGSETSRAILQMQLHSVLVFDEHLQGTPACWALTSRSDGDTFALWMRKLNTRMLADAGHAGWRPASFIIDACLAEINGIRCPPAGLERRSVAPMHIQHFNN